MTDYLVAAAIAAGIAIGIIVCGFLTVLILYSWAMLVSYLADKCDASIRRYRDKVSRRRAERVSKLAARADEPDGPKVRIMNDSEAEAWKLYYNMLTKEPEHKRRDYEWFYLGGKRDV